MNPIPHPPLVIVNADDFGMNSAANHAIVQAFERGWISSATLMANMPGFEEACQLAHQHHLVGWIGTHLNLTCGTPLTNPIRSCSRLCDEAGNFRPRGTRFRLSARERQAAETEMGAQVRACIERGVKPTHLDSHHHVHTEWALGGAAIAIAERYDIPAIRLSRNCGPGIGGFRWLYKLAYNSRLQLHGLAKTRYFGSSSDVGSLLQHASGPIEVMVHLTSEDGHDSGDCQLVQMLQRAISPERLAGYPPGVA